MRSLDFVPVFIDTLTDATTTKRFGESYGSYPVLRVMNADGEDLAGRIDGNLVAGHIPLDEVLTQLATGQLASLDPGLSDTEADM